MSRTTYIHINQHVIKQNAATGSRLPVVTVKDYLENRYGFQANILDDNGKVVASVLYSPDEPILACGARVVIKTRQPVVVSQDIPGQETSEECAA